MNEGVLYLATRQKFREKLRWKERGRERQTERERHKGEKGPRFPVIIKKTHEINFCLNFNLK